MIHHRTTIPESRVKRILSQALIALGVRFAGRDGDYLRWSVTDLATDLAPLVTRELNEEPGDFMIGY